MGIRGSRGRSYTGLFLLVVVLASLFAAACVDDAVLGPPPDEQSDVAATPLSTSGSGIDAADEVRAVIDSQARLVVAHVATADGSTRRLIAFRDPDSGDRISDVRYESRSWQTLGDGITLNGAWALGIAIDASGRPLVAFIDFEDDGAGGLGEFVGLSVLEYSGTTTEVDAEGADPVVAYYDIAFGLTGKSERRFYIDLMNRCGGPVLDLAGGTGRLTLAAATAGFSATYVDYTPWMHQRLKAKIGTPPARTGS